MSNEIQFLLYNMPNADGKVQVVIKDETLWCTQKAMAQLFWCRCSCYKQAFKEHL